MKGVHTQKKNHFLRSSSTGEINKKLVRLEKQRHPIARSARLLLDDGFLGLTVLLHLFLSLEPPILPFTEDHDGAGQRGSCASRKNAGAGGGE